MTIVPRTAPNYICPICLTPLQKSENSLTCDSAHNFDFKTNDLINIFSGNDEEWKYSVLGLLFISNNAVFNKKLVDEINRMAVSPTDNEKKADVQEIAIQVIESWESFLPRSS